MNNLKIDLLPVTIHIPLTKGKVAVIDRVDLALVGHLKWYAMQNTAGNWYAHHKPYKLPYISMHRLLMGLKTGNGGLVDHKDGDSLNNRRGNLRMSSWSLNGANRHRRAGACKFRGMNFTSGKYQVVVGREYVGRFEDEVEAAKAYDVAASRIYGDHAILNFPEGAAIE